MNTCTEQTFFFGDTEKYKGNKDIIQRKKLSENERI